MVHSTGSMAHRLCRPRRRTRRTGIPIRFVLAVMVVAAAHTAVVVAGDNPIRAFRVSLSAMSSQVAIQRAVVTATSSGFDTLIAPVSLLPRNESNPFDGEAELLRLARQAGLRVHLSVVVNVAAGTGELPASRNHVIYQHPEWLMVPRRLAPEMIHVDMRSPAYLGQIARWTRANADRVNGLYVSPLDPDAASYLVGAVVAAVQRHPADGVYLEAVDFPGADFDYSRRALDLFRGKMRITLPPAERTRMDEVEAIDPFGYADEFPEEWREFRESALTQLLGALRNALTAVNPKLSVTVGATSDPDASIRDHFQNWRIWLDRGLVDRIGYRSRSSGTVLFSLDGVVPPDPTPLTSARAVGISPSR
jgi:hypothetical protein